MSLCKHWREEGKVFPPKLPPRWFVCMNSGGPLFQLKRGQGAERKSWLSHTESSHTLTDNVTHKGGREMIGTHACGSDTTRLHRGKLQQHILNGSAYLKNISAKVSTKLLWEIIAKAEYSTMPPTHTPSATKYRHSDKWVPQQLLHKQQRLCLTVPASMYNSVPLIRENILRGKKSTCRHIRIYCPRCCRLEKDGGETDCRGKHSFSKLKRSQAGFSSLYSSVLLCFWKIMEQRTGRRLNLNPVLNSLLNVLG